jgi:CDP-6-deoxy-D-xylo-4-hexulose-3-dehydrase
MNFPLMRNNILRQDLDAVIEHLKQDDPILTHGANVRAFEEEWSAWLGVKYSVLRQFRCIGQPADAGSTQDSPP